MLFNFKQRVFTFIAPLARHYRVLKVLSGLLILMAFATPVIWPKLDTGIWLLLFALFGFSLSTYALLRLAHHHDPKRKGVIAWFVHLGENLIFVSWFLVLFAIVLLVIKLVLFMWQH